MQTQTFVAANPGTGTKGTRITAAYMNNVNSELSNILVELNITPDATKTDQISQALKATYAPINSPTLTGIPLTSTPGSSPPQNQIATCGYVADLVTSGQIGYPVVEQGGGADMGTNKMYIGWATDASGVVVQVDSTTVGKMVLSTADTNTYSIPNFNYNHTTDILQCRDSNNVWHFIAEQSWVTSELGAYLPLTGGTITGNLTVNDNTYLGDININNETGGTYILYNGTSEDANQFNPTGTFAGTTSGLSRDYTNKNVMSWCTYDTGDTNSGYKWYDYSSYVTSSPLMQLAELNGKHFQLSEYCAGFSVYHASSLDNGAIFTDGNGSINTTGSINVGTDIAVGTNVILQGTNGICFNTSNSAKWLYYNETNEDLTVTTNFFVPNTLNAGTIKSGPNIYLSGASGTEKVILFQTGGVNRWDIDSSAASETGSNAGSDFNISSYNDDGSYKQTPLTIYRVSGQINVTTSLTVPTMATTDNSQNVANTSYVHNYLGTITNQTLLTTSAPTFAGLTSKGTINAPSITFNNGGTSGIYQDTNTGDVVIETNNGSNHYTTFNNDGSVNVNGAFTATGQITGSGDIRVGTGSWLYTNTINPYAGTVGVNGAISASGNITAGGALTSVGNLYVNTGDIYGDGGSTNLYYGPSNGVHVALQADGNCVWYDGTTVLANINSSGGFNANSVSVGGAPVATQSWTQSWVNSYAYGGSTTNGFYTVVEGVLTQSFYVSVGSGTGTSDHTVTFPIGFSGTPVLVQATSSRELEGNYFSTVATVWNETEGNGAFSTATSCIIRINSFSSTATPTTNNVVIFVTATGPR